MDYLKLSIETSQEGLDLLCAALMEFGIGGFEIEDPQEFMAFANTKSDRWDYIAQALVDEKESKAPTVSFYLPKNGQGDTQFAQVQELLLRLGEEKGVDYGSLRLFHTSLKEEDWAHTWKQYFHPFLVGGKLLIKPSWEDCGVQAGQVVMEIDPDTSFGTGKHETTHMCLEEICALPLAGKQILDMGCGSGILSLGAMLLGAHSVTGVDIEENSIAISKENMVRNGIDKEKYRFLQGDILEDKGLFASLQGVAYDYIFANIVSDIIKAQSGAYKQLLSEDGLLMVSGVIDTRKEEVKSHLLAAGFHLCKERETKGWVMMLFSQQGERKEEFA